MGLRWELERPLLILTTEGDVDYHEGLETLGAAVDAASAQGRGWHLLFDIRRSTENRASGELEGIASFIAGRLGPLSGRCAVLAGDDLHYGLARVFEVYAEPAVQVEVFRDEAAARSFLEADES